MDQVDCELRRERGFGHDVVRPASIFVGALLAVGLGVLGLSGWVFNLELLQRTIPRFSLLNPATALSLMAAGCAIGSAGLRSRRLSSFAALIVAAIALAKLTDMATGMVPVDRWLFASSLDGPLVPVPSRMAPNTAVAMLMTGAALYLHQAPLRHAKVTAQLLTIWVMLMGMFVLVGYGFHLSYFRRIGAYLPMAMPTAIGLLTVGAGLLAITCDTGLMLVARDDGPAGTMVRITLPFVLTVPLIVGILRMLGEQHGLYGEQAGMALQIMSSVVVASTLLMFCALALRRSDLARRDRERDLRNSEQFNRLVASANPDCISLLDEDGVVLFANEALVRAHGFPGDVDLVGHSYGYRLDPATAIERDLAFAIARSGGVGRFTQGYSLPASGECRWFDTIISKLPPDHDWPFRYLAISRDVSEKREIEEQMRWKASHDDLTLLPNRAHFQVDLDRAVRMVGQEGFALLSIDIDNFKVVNDTLGHDAGDVLLKTMAERIAGAVRSGDVVARLAGDEFAVIARGIRTESAAVAMAERIFENLRQPWIYEGRLGECRVSIGASLAPRHGDNSDELLKHADIALYEAKSRGRGQLAVFRQSMKSAVEKRSRQISLARHALASDFIIPYYQPKVELATGRVAGFEALLRWRHPTQGVQLPNTIQAAFEDLELANKITEHMLSHVLLDMVRWLDRDLPFGHVAINVTAADLRQENFPDLLIEKLRAHNLPHHCLQVEITETVFMGRGAEYVERALRLLHDAGIRVALDDFGTGYASLSHLKQFPVDIVKIDRSFLHDFALDPQNQAIINTVISLGHSLDIEIVAEGIETPDQERHLLARGCTYGQGYLYGKAMPAVRVPRSVTYSAREVRQVA